MMRIVSFVVILGLTGALTGCGQKGPLVLPDNQHPQKRISVPRPSAAPTPQPAATDAAASGEGTTAPSPQR